MFLMISCGGDKQSQLAKLKQQQNDIAGKIRTLESTEVPAGEGHIDPSKFKYVGLTDVNTNVFDHYITVQGRLDGDQNTAVSADVPGTVSAIYATVGKVVKKGQVLAQIDDSQYITQMESLESQYKFASDMFSKQENLWKQKIGSEVQYLQAKTTKESLEKQIASLTQQIDKFKIKSPVDGTIEECNIKIGSMVAPDPRAAAYRVVAFRNLKVTAEVSEAYAARVQEGDKLIILFPDINKKIEARVDFVSRYINPVNRTFVIESRLPEGKEYMKANMIAILQINDYHSPSSIQIPMNVIQTDREGSYVYVIRKKEDHSGAFRQPVVIGNTYNGVAEIIAGLSVNDKVISAGFQELIDGEYVRF
jgi:RND family efflux transporter MFP subunit